MTPMVDLAFLLITFFVMTAEMSKPTAMSLIMPADGPSMQTYESRSLTLLLGSDNNISWYMGMAEEADRMQAVGHCSYSGHSGLRTVLMAKQQELVARNIDRQELTVLIKPADEASYSNVVDALDEMQLTGVKKYAIVKMDEIDRELLSR